MTMSFPPTPSVPPIFLMPNTTLTDAEEENSRLGWESFPLLVESLEDEEEEQYHLLRKSVSLSFRRFTKDIEVIEACRTDSDNCPKNKCNKSPRRKSVAFSTVAIREHSVVVGDHPCAADSLPISLGWAHAEESRVVDLNTYETIRSSHRRCVSDMQLSFVDRKNILQRVGGLSERDIVHEQRRAFRDDQIAHMRRVHTVAAMAQAQTLQQEEEEKEEEAAHRENNPAQPPPPSPPQYLPPAVLQALERNPGCPIRIEPRHASGITA